MVAALDVELGARRWDNGEWLGPLKLEDLPSTDRLDREAAALGPDPEQRPQPDRLANDRYVDRPILALASDRQLGPLPLGPRILSWTRSSGRPWSGVPSSRVTMSPGITPALAAGPPSIGETLTPRWPRRRRENFPA